MNKKSHRKNSMRGLAYVLSFILVLTSINLTSIDAYAVGAENQDILTQEMTQEQQGQGEQIQDPAPAADDKAPGSGPSDESSAGTDTSGTTTEVTVVSRTITQFKELESEITSQKLTEGKDFEELKFPESLEVTVESKIKTVTRTSNASSDKDKTDKSEGEKDKPEEASE